MGTTSQTNLSCGPLESVNLKDLKVFALTVGTCILPQSLSLIYNTPGSVVGLVVLPTFILNGFDDLPASKNKFLGTSASADFIPLNQGAVNLLPSTSNSWPKFISIFVLPPNP